VVVTNTDQQDVLRGSFSGTAEHMDLSAPGTGSFSTRPNNEYGPLGGSSASTPHVSGGIGLLYSAPCEGFAEFTKTEPAQAAALMKSFILGGTTQIAELQGKTVSGGRLNLEGSLNLLQEFCGGSAGQLEITSIIPNPTALGDPIRISFQTPDEALYQFRVTNILGQTLFEGEINSTTFGNNILEIATTNFSIGVYFITVEDSRDTRTEPFMIY